MTIYIWASSMDKAMVEMIRGNYWTHLTDAMQHKRTVDHQLWTVKFRVETI